MKTVLMIAPYFIPRRRVGALRPFKFATHLHSFGYQPTVLTIPGKGNRTTDLEKKLLENIPIISINTPFDRTSQPKSTSKPSKGDRKLADWVDRHTPLDTWIFLLLLRYPEIRHKVKKLDPDLIWATGDPWSGLWLGEKLARSLSKPFVADFRDPWTLTDVNLRKRSEFSMEIDRKVEKRIIQNANRIVFTSKTTEKKYAEEYNLPKEKTVSIYNSFDSNLIKEREAEHWDVNLDPKLLHLLFFGRFRRLSPVTPIADSLKLLKTKSARDASAIRIHSFGKPDPENLQTIRDYGLETNFTFHEPVVPEKMVPVLKKADILLLSTNRNREHIIPAKLWDYLSVDVPILSILPNPEVGEIIMKIKAGIQVHPSKEEEIADLLQGFTRAKLNNDTLMFSPEKELPDRDMFEAKHTTGELAILFDEILADG